MPPRSSALPLSGLLAAAAAVVLGAGWQIATRAGVRTSMTPIDLALLRYTVPALLLAPVWWRLLRHWPDGLSFSRVALMLVGGGLPFGLLAMAGARFAPAADMGTMMAGAMPLAVALVAALWLREAINTRRAIGLFLVMAAMVLVLVPSLLANADGRWQGHLLFLSAAAAWATYTVAYRASGLEPWCATALLALGSAVAIVPLWWLAGSDLTRVPAVELVWQILWQGVLAGVGGVWAYGATVAALGAQRAGLSGALVPPTVTLGALILLGEVPSPTTLIAVVLATMGVVVAGWPGSTAEHAKSHATPSSRD
ncbi:MAG: DMT family transporter [Alphaproteobacteria bacterium]|nr:MAG: DMT family transporter [Alphaproteobacteria bacterium]